MMNMLKKRLNKKGFTLAELLIVVAIIAILVAVSIPIFTSRLEKARESTDVANMRAAKAEAYSAYVGGDFEQGATTPSEWGTAVSGVYSAYYDAENGVFVATAAKPDAYGKGTHAEGGISYSGYTQDTDYTSAVIKVSVDSSNGEITVEWEDATAKK